MARLYGPDVERVHRRLSALGRLLVDAGHMTPMGQRQLEAVLVEELGGANEVEHDP